MNRRMRLCIFLALITGSLSFLFEDQVGKFDWRQQYIGCPENVVFDKSNKGDRIFVSTKENVFASLSSGTGSLNWRRIQETTDAGSNSMMVKDKKSLYTISNDGQFLRVWNKGNGALRWQKSLYEDHSTSVRKPSIGLYGEQIYVLATDSVFVYNIDGELLKLVVIAPNEYSYLIATENDVSVIYSIGGKVYSRSVTGEAAIKSVVSTVSLESCKPTAGSLICQTSSQVFVVEISRTLNVHILETGVSIRNIYHLSNNYFASVSALKTVFYSLPSLTKAFEISLPVEGISQVGEHIVIASAGEIHLYSANDGKPVQKIAIPHGSFDNTAHVSGIFTNSATNEEIEAVIVFSDCRVQFIVISLATTKMTVEWVREEALARISSVEMTDLPLSESQKLIEDEFDDQGTGLSAFFHRIVAQVIQLKQSFISAVNEIFTLSQLISVRSVSDMFTAARRVSRDVEKPTKLERDFFNLRKMIIVSSLDGSVFGIDSADGSIVWKLNLGSNFAPLKTQLGEQKIPLFVQRTTSNYHLAGQVAVVFKDKITDHGIIFFVNPITGELIHKEVMSTSIGRVDMLPFTDENHLHSILIVDKNMKIFTIPSLAKDSAENSAPVYMLLAEENHLSGSLVNLKAMQLEKLWSTDLHLEHDEQVIAIKGKHPSQKVHSQGRVLIDRNVQYKYSNPNLVAVATLDSTNQRLTITMLDSVTGQIVHTATLQKATGPVHLVHCENWLAYSYWSEKGRRTELGIIELYEGEEQSTMGEFDSFVPPRKIIEVSSQSYIYAQGVNSIAVTETEQGLTTRSVLLALPFGGIHEVSRKFLDANRPMELTQEMREEMMIPYMPEIPIASEDMVNYNQTVHRIHGIKTSSSGLESTSLMLAYGMDVFFTRLTPSGTFDILKDDFDHLLISLVLFALFAGSFVSKRMARNNALKAAWA